MEMQDLELGHAQWDSKYVMMSPSPVHLPEQLAAAEGRHIDFQPSVDESQFPDPIIPSQEMLHNLLYSPPAVGTGIDVGSFDPLLCLSSETGAAVRTEAVTCFGRRLGNGRVTTRHFQVPGLTATRARPTL